MEDKPGEGGEAQPSEPAEAKDPVKKEEPDGTKADEKEAGVQKRTRGPVFPRKLRRLVSRIRLKMP